MNYEILFESDRIYFIKLTEDLINDYLEMVNDIEVQKFISHDIKTFTIDGEREWINDKLKENAMIYSMIEKETNDFIGNIEIIGIKNNIAKIGISITSKKQDNHFGSEAIKRIIDYSFDDLNLDGVELNVYDFNKRAIHCYEKLGFKKDGPGDAENDIHMILKKT